MLLAAYFVLNRDGSLTQEDVDRALPGLTSLVAVTGTPGVAVAVSFGAYLVGSALSAAQGALALRRRASEPDENVVELSRAQVAKALKGDGALDLCVKALTFGALLPLIREKRLRGALQVDEHQEEEVRRARSRADQERHLDELGRPLVQALLQTNAGRERLAEVLVDLPSTFPSLSKELSQLPARLVAEQPAVFERWDGLDSEVELRRAIVIPLLLLGVSFTVIDQAAAAVVAYSLGLVSAFMAAGVAFDARARLLEVLESGIVDVRSFDGFERSDIV